MTLDEFEKITLEFDGAKVDKFWTMQLSLIKLARAANDMKSTGGSMPWELTEAIVEVFGDEA